MRTRSVFFAASLCIGLLNFLMTNAQSTGYVNKIITVNSGIFEVNPPYIDYVTVQAYKPQSGDVKIINTIYTQSAQFIVVSEKMAFVAAQDSIIKYDLNLMQRVAAVRDSGLNQLAVFNGKLIVSKQYPVINHFVEVLDTANLGVIAEIQGISGECSGISMFSDTVYVAVNGGWTGTVGKLAIIDPSTWTLKSEVDLGPGAIGISNLYNYKGKIVSVNVTPYGGYTGSISVYNPPDRSFANVLLMRKVASGAGIKDSLLYLGIDDGIGNFNLNTQMLEDSLIIPDPGSMIHKYITSVIVDTLTGRIYTNIGDYYAPGYCLVTALNGDSITFFQTGISSQAIAVDYRPFPEGLSDRPSNTALVNLFPNPVSDNLTISLREQLDINTVKITDITGRIMLMQAPEDRNTLYPSVSCSNIPSGMYYLILETSKGRFARPFVKN